MNYASRLGRLEKAMAAYNGKPRRSHRIIADGIDLNEARRDYERAHGKIRQGEIVVIRRIVDPVKAQTI